jgi:uncharacterized SAM-binding protein YcdF (DUF218 family)
MLYVGRGWRWLRWIILLAGLGIIVLIVIIVQYGTVDRARPADVIVVLGGGDVGTARRTRHAAALYAQGYAPALLCTGSATAAAPYNEAEWCARIAQEHGVPAAAIVLDTVSRSTAENAHEAAAIMQTHGWRTAVLVSDDFHLWRAVWMFRSAGVKVWPSPAQVTTGSLARGEKVYSVAREVAAVGCYLSESRVGLRCPHW